VGQVVLQGVIDHAAQEGDVGAGSHLGIDVGLGGAAGVARVDDDQLAALVHGLLDPLEGDRVVLGRVAADDEDAVAVLQVNPVIRHCPASE